MAPILFSEISMLMSDGSSSTTTPPLMEFYSIIVLSLTRQMVVGSSSNTHARIEAQMALPRLDCVLSLGCLCDHVRWKSWTSQNCDYKEQPRRYPFSSDDSISATTSEISMLRWGVSLCTYSEICRLKKTLQFFKKKSVFLKQSVVLKLRRFVSVFVTWPRGCDASASICVAFLRSQLAIFGWTCNYKYSVYFKFLNLFSY